MTDVGFGVKVHCPACEVDFEVLPVPNRVSIISSSIYDNSYVQVEFQDFFIGHKCERRDNGRLPS